MSILVLQAFASKRRSAGGAAHHESLAARIGEGPDHIADALEPEHRVIGEEWNRGYPVIGIGRTSRGKRGHGARLGNSLFQDLPVLFLAVIQEHVLIVGLVELSLAGVNADLANNGLHAEGASLVRNDWNDELANLRILHQLPQHADEAHGGGHGAALRSGHRVSKL